MSACRVSTGPRLAREASRGRASRVLRLASLARSQQLAHACCQHAMLSSVAACLRWSAGLSAAGELEGELRWRIRFSWRSSAF